MKIPRKYVIRQVHRKWRQGPRKGQVKEVIDRRSHVVVAQVESQAIKQCQGCHLPVTGTAYDVLWIKDGRRMGSTFVPLIKRYHPACLPREAHPCLRFFTP